jgi:hypothetical protein
MNIFLFRDLGWFNACLLHQEQQQQQKNAIVLMSEILQNGK